MWWITRSCQKGKQWAFKNINESNDLTDKCNHALLSILAQEEKVKQMLLNAEQKTTMSNEKDGNTDLSINFV